MVNQTWFVEPNASDMGGYYEYFNYIGNAASEGLFFPIMLLVIWVISFVSMLFLGSMERPAAAKAWIFASFFSMVLAIPLATLGFIASKFMYYTIVLLAIGVMWIILEGSRE